MDYLPCEDSDLMATRNRTWLDIDRDRARTLGISAKMAAEHGFYFTDTGEKVEWRPQVDAAITGTVSIPPFKELPETPSQRPFRTQVRVTNETTLMAGYRMHTEGRRPIALNFASGTNPGGGFLAGARAQEENLCRNSALFATLQGDGMYEYHRQHARDHFSDWAIVSPDVPVFRDDAGRTHDQPWPLSIITCAAPIAYRVGLQTSRTMLANRMKRMLAICGSMGYTSLVLGAWGCGAFGNDPTTTAADFANVLGNGFDGMFDQVIFAITDWSPDRYFLGPFAQVFCHNGYKPAA